MKAQVKIIDFGFARYLEQNELASTILGTPLFMDPKMLSAASNRKKIELDNNNNIYNDNNYNYNGQCMKNNIHFNNDKPSYYSIISNFESRHIIASHYKFCMRFNLPR